MEELKTYRLADICNSIQTGPFGSQLHKSDYVEFGTPIVMPKDITNGKINDNNISRISKNDVAKLFKHKLVPGNIIYPRRGDISKCALITSKEDGWVCGTGCIKVDINQQIANSTYVMYVLCQSETVNWIESNAVGTTMLNLNTSILSDLPIKLPSLNTQKKLANIVSSFDNKIALNRRINDNLEQQAQALFAEVFESDHTFTQLGAVIETCSGGTPSRNNLDYYIDGTICWVKSKELNRSFLFDTEEKIAQVGIDRSSAKLLPKNSVLIAMYGATVGEYCIIDKPMTCNQAICALLPSSDYPASYLYMFIKQKRNELINLAVGSAQQNISQVLIKGLSVSANLKLIAKFDKMVMPIFNMIRKNVKESIILEAERNTLLPRLMSSELKINDLNC